MVSGINNSSVGKPQPSGVKFTGLNLDEKSIRNTYDKGYLPVSKLAQDQPDNSILKKAANFIGAGIVAFASFLTTKQILASKKDQIIATVAKAGGKAMEKLQASIPAEGSTLTRLQNAKKVVFESAKNKLEQLAPEAKETAANIKDFSETSIKQLLGPVYGVFTSAAGAAVATGAIKELSEKDGSEVQRAVEEAMSKASQKQEIS